jgi:cell division protein FtsB
MQRLSGVKILAFLLTVGILVLMYIWNSYVVDRKASEIITLEKQIEALKIENTILEAKYDKLVSANYIIPFARQKLGLVFPKGNQKEITVDKGEF